MFFMFSSSSISDKNSPVIQIIPLYVVCSFYIAASIFYFSLLFSILIMLYIGVTFFVLLLLDVHETSWICKFVFIWPLFLEKFLCLILSFWDFRNTDILIFSN